MKQPEPNRADRHVYIAEFAHAQYLSFLTAKKKKQSSFQEKKSDAERKRLYSPLKLRHMEINTQLWIMTSFVTSLQKCEMKFQKACNIVDSSYWHLFCFLYWYGIEFHKWKRSLKTHPLFWTLLFSSANQKDGVCVCIVSVLNNYSNISQSH